MLYRYTSSGWPSTEIAATNDDLRGRDHKHHLDSNGPQACFLKAQSLRPFWLWSLYSQAKITVKYFLRLFLTFFSVTVLLPIYANFARRLMRYFCLLCSVNGSKLG